MGRPYSIDLRERVVAAVVTGGLSCHPSGEAIRLGHQHRRLAGWTPTGDRQRCTRQDGRVQAKEDCGRAPLWLLQRIEGRVHPARACRRARPARPQGRLSDGVEVRPWARVEFQKKRGGWERSGRTSPGAAPVEEVSRPPRPRRLVFIDETWTKTNMAPLRGWGMRRQAPCSRAAWPLEDDDLSCRLAP